MAVVLLFPGGLVEHTQPALAAASAVAAARQ